MRELTADDRSGLLYRKWGHASCGTALLPVHGMGGHTERWEPLAGFMLSRGIAVYAPELEGFGETKGLRGHVDSFRVYYRGIKRLIDIILADGPGCRVFLAGESMGGLIAFMAAAMYQKYLSGLICVSPAFRNIMRFSLLEYLAITAAAVLFPKKRFTMPFDASMCTSDRSLQEKMRNDPREIRVASARLLFEIVKAQVSCAHAARSVDRPVMFLLAGEDTMVSTSAAEKILAMTAADIKTLKIYPGMRHALTVEREKEKVFRDMQEWMTGKARAGNGER